MADDAELAGRIADRPLRRDPEVHRRPETDVGVAGIRRAGAELARRDVAGPTTTGIPAAQPEPRRNGRAAVHRRSPSAGSTSGRRSIGIPSRSHSIGGPARRRPGRTSRNARAPAGSITARPVRRRTIASLQSRSQRGGRPGLRCPIAQPEDLRDDVLGRDDRAEHRRLAGAIDPAARGRRPRPNGALVEPAEHRQGRAAGVVDRARDRTSGR